MANVIIQVKNVSKSFDDFVVLDNVSLDVYEKENLVIFGKSGTGKSVLLKCIVKLLTPDKGTISIFDKDVSKLKGKELIDVRKRISFLFQSAALYDAMSVRENLEFALKKVFKLEQKEINQRVEWALDSVGLLNAIDKMPSDLSGGMRKRVGLARAIITKPEIIFYDEPTTGLDPITTKEISLLIKKLQQELNITSVTITHDMICAKIIADRSIFLKDGKIIYNGDLNSLFNSKDEFLRNFFSFDVIN
ncbi:MAG TPA: ATP-binding cassette domain-containing protein [Ignavibacteriales bacterium]|nr:ATP-binding cassette domain-containing protein [Ignavibacteriales bacterium]HOL80316.1 ATP-binding cassette domain-containing protein [Ignavibacteriales bacterium]HOM64595.1 ATP-binding cassette domain-containing protein [Ignavibacteriales bacterium]HPD66692.1 ATP-binding cassette domain-containing protein [Ignavibacteriales bacterium]HPP32505.1 ATP-binding cassette domain-containing protein [Ignavibacteriales bacterium]